MRIVGMIENMVGSSASIALRNILMMTGALAVLVYVSPSLTLYVALMALAYGYFRMTGAQREAAAPDAMLSTRA